MQIYAEATKELKYAELEKNEHIWYTFLNKNKGKISMIEQEEILKL
jgi:hypothetical protein